MLVYFYFEASGWSEYSKKVGEKRAQLKLYDLSTSLFTEYCIDRLSEVQLCKRYAVLSGEQFLSYGENPQRNPDLDRYHDTKKRLNEELNQAPKHSKLASLRLYLQHFDRAKFSSGRAFSGYASYSRFKKARLAYYNWLALQHKERKILSKLNLNIFSVLKAQFKHGSLTHLLSNLLMLLVFGTYVEQRLRSLNFLFIYLAGGSTALTLQVFSFHDPSVGLLGSSGNVSVVMGLFYTLYFSFYMRLYIPFLTQGTKIFTPINITMPLLFLSSDLLGYYANKSVIGGASNVAHLAHLLGFLVGVIYALILRFLRPVPWPFLYQYEIALMKSVSYEKSLRQKIKILQKILTHNKENIAARIQIYIELMNHRGSDRSPNFNKTDQTILRGQIPYICAILVAKNRIHQLYKLLMLIPKHHSLTYFFSSLGQMNTLVIADYALKQKNVYLAIKIFDSYVARYPKARQAAMVRKTMRSLMTNLYSHRDGHDFLLSYQEFNPKSALSNLIRQSQQELNQNLKSI